MSEVVETPVAEVKETKKSKSESISMTQESLLELLMKFNEASSDQLPAHLPRDRPGLQPMAAQGDDQQAVPSWRTHIP